MMVKMGQDAPSIRQVHFTPPTPRVGGIEVSTMARIRDRGGRREFLAPQRLDFDLLMRIDSGTAIHTVDFTDYRLAPGDVMWVGAGQVQQWGRIEDIEGPVILFGSHTLDERTRELMRSHGFRPRSHWPAADLDATPVAAALSLLVACASHGEAEWSELHETALAHSLAALLVRLILVQRADGSPSLRPTHEAYGWFRDHIEQYFRTWHKVSEYADRLGYSARTLNRLARQNVGLSAKQLIDERVVLEAKRQLGHADAPVAEIAAQLGFDDASNFSSYFRRHTGTTPAAFRGKTRGMSAVTPGVG
jgi:AraC-like DNA-binding protein